jgi:hypothetical protein
VANWHIARTCTGHRRTVLAADLCGCFYCLATFVPSDIVEWVDTDDQGVGQTALCPRCGVDAVIPSVPGSPITDELLGRLHRDAFGERGDERLPK